MDAQPLLLQRCFQEAANLSKRALERCIDEAVAALQAAEGGVGKLADRDEIALAWNSLLRLKASWGAQYAADLLVAFRKGPSVDSEGNPRTSPSSFASFGAFSTDFSSLSLVDDVQVSQGIEFARLSQQLQLHADPVMADLDALVSAVQGFPNVRPELNPLRPEVFALALRGLVYGANVEPGVRARWVQALAGPMGRELRGTYETLIDLLLSAKVEAVSYRVMAAPGGGGKGVGRGLPGERGRGAVQPGRAGPAGGVGGGAGGGGWGDGFADDAGTPASTPADLYVDPSRMDVREPLFHDFLVHGALDDQTRLADSYYARVEEELEALRAAPPAPSDSLRADFPPPDQDLSSGDRPVRRVDGQSPLSSRVWGAYASHSARRMVRAELKKEATHLGQVLGLEVVRQLVNQVAQDPRLLVPVRESIVALEPSLLRLAMVDPRFFSEETHPGRRLMERVAQRSFKFNDEYSAEFIQFFVSVTRSFNALNALKIDSAQPFNSALATLEAAWTESDRAEEARRHEVLDGLRFAEERQAAADQIACDISLRPDLDKVPGAVLDFLYGPWALVMAHARLVDQANQIDPRGFGTLVSDLVWSVKQDFTLKQPAKLMDMIPGMLRKLHVGLDLIGQDAREREPFFEILLRLHGPVLKLRRLKSELDAREPGVGPLDADLLPATAEQRIPKAAAQPWLAPRDQNQVGFEDTPLPSLDDFLSDDVAEPSEAQAETPDRTGPGVSMPPTQDPESVERVLQHLHTGCWVDLCSGQRWRRAQLVWASAKGTLFMFESHGGHPHSMTRRSCERLVSEHLLRLVGSHGVVAHALATLKQESKDMAPASSSAAEPA